MINEHKDTRTPPVAEATARSEPTADTGIKPGSGEADPSPRRRRNRRNLRTRHLTTRLLVHIFGWSLLVLCLLSIAVFRFAFKDAREAIVDTLHSEQRLAVSGAQAFFSRVEARGEILSRRFLERYRASAGDPGFASRFERWYVETEPGVFRLDERFFEGTVEDGFPFSGLSAFVAPRSAALDAELRRRSVAAQLVLMELGPAWAGEVTNTHFSMPENILLMYSTTDPWGQLADPGLVITDFGTVRSTLQSENPSRRPNWTGLYYDLSADLWTITYQRPIDDGGRHLANASFDLGLDELLRELVATPGRKATTQLVINSDGQLIATSLPLDDSLRDEGFIALEDLPETVSGNQALKDLVARLDKSGGRQPRTHEAQGQVLIAQHLDRPDWWYISIYSEEELLHDALVLPLQILAVSLLLLIIILLVVYWLVKVQISRPLTWIANAASMVSGANYRELLNSSTLLPRARGEVALVLRSFHTAAHRLYFQQEQLEQEVEARTRELEKANQRLDRLAHLDGLTGLRNRRSFERDLAAALEGPAESRPWLCLGDIDSFKAYNDSYGHEAGDQALRKVATALAAACPGRVYRYGGEELACLVADSDVKGGRLFEALCSTVASLGIDHRASKGGQGILTISMGATRLEAGDNADEAIRRADKHLYAAKRAGGNAARAAS